MKRYKYVGKERDEETGLYYYGARYYSAWLARFISVDPLQHEYPYYTPYQYAGNKPITYIDLDGLEEENTNNQTDNIVPKTQEAQRELDLYTKGEYKNKRKKDKQKDKLIEPAFRDLINGFRENEDIIVNFTTNFEDVSELLNTSTEPGGTIAYSGKNEDGKDIYWVYWSADKTIKNEFGASGIFEESKHLQEAIEGKEMSFEQSTNGKWGIAFLDINDEVRAKMWVAENVNISETYEVESDLKTPNGFSINYNFSTHYGFIKELGDREAVRDFLRNGKIDKQTVKHEGIGSLQKQSRKVPNGSKYSNENLFPNGNLRNPNN